MFGKTHTQAMGCLNNFLTRLRMCLFALAAALLVPFAASAHTLDAALAQFWLDGSSGDFVLRIDGNLEAILADISPDVANTNDSPNAEEYNRLRNLPADDLQAEFDAFRDTMLGGIHMRFDGRDVPLVLAEEIFQPVGDLSEPRNTTLKLTGRVPEGAEAMSFVWEPRLGDVMFQTTGERTRLTHIERLEDGAQSEILKLEEIAARTRWQMVLDFLVIGFEHIVPKGLDHILFVVGIFLLSTRLRPLVTQVSAFTVAHTCTLALGAMGIVNLPPSIVEPLIALSIAYVGVENIFLSRLSAWRPALVFMFGLLHGLGFAGILNEFDLAAGDFIFGLLSFNIGVELGQLTVIGACFLLVGFWFSGKDWYRRVIVVPGSLLIALIGGYWFVERAFL